MKNSADYWIEQLQLLPHPEGGYYREVYRSAGSIPHAALPTRFAGDRSYSTSIYYLLGSDDFSAFHRIASDETWHFYAGRPLQVHCLSDGKHSVTTLGREPHRGQLLQWTVAAGVWFASRPMPRGLEPHVDEEYSLVGCTVSPGFDFQEFELATKEQLLAEFPTHGSVIDSLTR